MLFLDLCVVGVDLEKLLFEYLKDGGNLSRVCDPVLCSLDHGISTLALPAAPVGCFHMAPDPADLRGDLVMSRSRVLRSLLMRTCDYSHLV